jgi:Uma2 family endonuclease
VIMTVAAPDLHRVSLQMPRHVQLDDDLLFAICQANREYRIERNSKGDIEIMPPTGGVTGSRNAELGADLTMWARTDGRGKAFDSSTGFILPNGAMRSPDASWVLRERLAQLTPVQKRRFLPLAPELAIELASPSDDIDDLQAKMQEYRANGVQLGWLILPEQRRVWVYRHDSVDPERLDDPAMVGDDALLPGLRIDLQRIWTPGL